MAFTVKDFQDLLRLLERHPEWRNEVRRHVLTEELLTLPALVRQLAEAQLRTEARLDTLEARLDALTQRVDALTERVDALTEQMSALVRQVAALAAQMAALTDQVGALTGDVLELNYARRAPGYFGRLARRVRVFEPGPLADLLDDAVEDRRLTEAERETILHADLVLSGRRREDGADIYLLVEISAGIALTDAERAAERSGLLEKLGRPVIPVVAGHRIHPEARAFAERHGVWQLLDGRTSPPG